MGVCRKPSKRQNYHKVLTKLVFFLKSGLTARPLLALGLWLEFYRVLSFGAIGVNNSFDESWEEHFYNVPSPFLRWSKEVSKDIRV